MINQQIDKVQMELDKAQEVKQENTNQETAKYGSYDIPKWSLPYIIRKRLTTFVASRFLISVSE